MPQEFSSVVCVLRKALNMLKSIDGLQECWSHLLFQSEFRDWSEFLKNSSFSGQNFADGSGILWQFRILQEVRPLVKVEKYIKERPTYWFYSTFPVRHLKTTVELFKHSEFSRIPTRIPSKCSWTQIIYNVHLLVSPRGNPIFSISHSLTIFQEFKPEFRQKNSWKHNLKIIYNLFLYSSIAKRKSNFLTSLSRTTPAVWKWLRNHPDAYSNYWLNNVICQG